MKKYNEEYSDNSNYMIGRIDRGLEESPLPIIVFDIDPTTKEICDSVDFLIRSKWLGNSLFVRRVNYTNYYDKNKTDTGVLFSDSEEVFDSYEKCGFYYQDKGAPMVIGLNHSGCKKSRYEEFFPNELVLVKQDDGTIQTRDDYEKGTKRFIKF